METRFSGPIERAGSSARFPDLTPCRREGCTPKGQPGWTLAHVLHRRGAAYRVPLLAAQWPHMIPGGRGSCRAADWRASPPRNAARQEPRLPVRDTSGVPEPRKAIGADRGSVASVLFRFGESNVTRASCACCIRRRDCRFRQPGTWADQCEWFIEDSGDSARGRHAMPRLAAGPMAGGERGMPARRGHV